MRRRAFLKTAAGCGALLGAGLGRSGFAGDVAFADPEALKTRLLGGARDIFARNLVVSEMGRFHLPSAKTYRRFYAWDSGWNIISQSAFDVESAIQELIAVFNYQNDSGQVPHEALVPELPRDQDPTFQSFGYKLFQENGSSYMIDPPSFLAAAGVLYEKTRDPRIAELLPKMESCLEYLLGPRDLFGDGLVAIVHPWESGTDMAPAFDAPMGLNALDPLAGIKASRQHHTLVDLCSSLDWDLARIKDANVFVLEDPGLNALTASGALAMAGIYESSGKAETAAHWRGRGKALIRAMEEHMWDEERGFFFPRWDSKNPKLSKRTSLTGLVPVMTGLVSPDKAERMVNDYLLSPEHFQAPWLVPFNSVSEMRKEPPSLLHSQLWRGSCIWINMNWMAARSAALCGKRDAAVRIVRETALMIDSHGFREYYRPKTGKGVGAPGFTWPALVLPMIEEFGLG